MVKFYERQTVQTTVREVEEELNVPQVIFCTKYPFKKDALKNIGLNDTFLLVSPITYLENINITDLRQVWDKGTYSLDEMSIFWLLMYGRFYQLC